QAQRREPRARSEPAKRLARARVGESEGRSPSKKNENDLQPSRSPRAARTGAAADHHADSPVGQDDAPANGGASQRLAQDGIRRTRGSSQESTAPLRAAQTTGAVSATDPERCAQLARVARSQAWRL